MVDAEVRLPHSHPDCCLQPWVLPNSLLLLLQRTQNFDLCVIAYVVTCGACAVVTTTWQITMRGHKHDFKSICTPALQIDPAELHFLILHYLASGPCSQAVTDLEHQALANGLLPCRHDVFGEC